MYKDQEEINLTKVINKIEEDEQEQNFSTYNLLNQRFLENKPLELKDIYTLAKYAVDEECLLLFAKMSPFEQLMDLYSKYYCSQDLTCIFDMFDKIIEKWDIFEMDMTEEIKSFIQTLDFYEASLVLISKFLRISFITLPFAFDTNVFKTYILRQLSEDHSEINISNEILAITTIFSLIGKHNDLCALYTHELASLWKHGVYLYEMLFDLDAENQVFDYISQMLHQLPRVDNDFLFQIIVNSLNHILSLTLKYETSNINRAKIIDGIVYVITTHSLYDIIEFPIHFELMEDFFSRNVYDNQYPVHALLRSLIRFISLCTFSSYNYTLPIELIEVLFSVCGDNYDTKVIFAQMFIHIILKNPEIFHLFEKGSLDVSQYFDLYLGLLLTKEEENMLHSYIFLQQFAHSNQDLFLSYFIPYLDEIEIILNEIDTFDEEDSFCKTIIENLIEMADDT